MKIINKKNTSIVAVTLAVIMITTLSATVTMSISNAFAFGGGSDDGWLGSSFKHDSGHQHTDQKHHSHQDGQCISAEPAIADCNNADLGLLFNKGNHALGEQ